MSGCSSMAAEIAADAILGVADDVEALLCEKCRERVARQRMIVDDEHAICHVPLIGRRRAADK